MPGQADIHSAGQGTDSRSEKLAGSPWNCVRTGKLSYQGIGSNGEPENTDSAGVWIGRMSTYRKFSVRYVLDGDEAAWRRERDRGYSENYATIALIRNILAAGIKPESLRRLWGWRKPTPSFFGKCCSGRHASPMRWLASLRIWRTLQRGLRTGSRESAGRRPQRLDCTSERDGAEADELSCTIRLEVR
jgi:hypothetical protein